MEVLYARCAGVDVHKKTVVVCRIIPGPDGKPIKEIRTFTTMTRDLLALSDWLAEGGSLTWRWRAPASIGSPSTTCSKAPSPSCW